MVLSALILLEFERVLKRPKFPAYLDPDALPLDELRVQAATVVPLEVVAVLDDPTVDVSVGTALAGGANIIVSGDQPLPRLNAYGGAKVVTPRRFLDMLDIFPQMV